MICCSLLGIFPWQFIFTENPIFQKAYKYYSNVTLSYLALFIFGAYVELLFLFHEETLRIDEIMRNLCVTLLCTVTIIRVVIMRVKPHFRNIIQEIIDKEHEIFTSSNDETILDIYRGVAANTARNIKFLYVQVVIMCLMHHLRPFFVVDIVKRGNETVALWTFPVSVALPFDVQRNFWGAFCFSSSMALNGASFLTYIDALIFSLIAYAVGQLKILHYILINFDEFKGKFGPEMGNFLDDELLSVLTFKKCINMHRVIIKYIDNFNAGMSVFMVFDFLQTSLQLASIMSEFILMDLTVMTVCYAVSFLISSTYRLYMFYYFANEIMYLNETLPLSLWQSKWYQQPKRVKYMMQIFILKCRTPLVLTIGSFGKMTLSTFLSILQASYSYFTLIYTSQHK
ncbi:odorant receptor 33c-like isoform X2 [Anthonomus grandis grandis]|uniref:odorant receptor 33c-like isoform X2 n=1 Tax=Anthonomus grandis grandis TaxID=2921223 RepID=UPI002165CA6C|nr:odorant receptor 33c-like isoform X2 [Anthonomus grandis grandis]